MADDGIVLDESCVDAEAETGDIVEGVYIEPVDDVQIEPVYEGTEIDVDTELEFVRLDVEALDDKRVGDVDVDAVEKFDALFGFLFLGFFDTTVAASPKVLPVCDF